MKSSIIIENFLDYRIAELRKRLFQLTESDSQSDFLTKAAVNAKLDELNELKSFINEEVY